MRKLLTLSLLLLSTSVFADALPSFGCYKKTDGYCFEPSDGILFWTQGGSYRERFGTAVGMLLERLEQTEQVAATSLNEKEVVSTKLTKEKRLTKRLKTKCGIRCRGMK